MTADRQATSEAHRPQGAFARGLRRILDGLERVLYVAMGACLIGTVVSVSVQVVGRYLLRDIPIWTEETARYTTIWVGMLAMPLGIRRQAHITIDALAQVPSPALRAVMKWVGVASAATFLAVLTWYGWLNLGPSHRQISGGLGIPMSAVSAAVPVGSVLSIVYLIESALWPNDPVK